MTNLPGWTKAEDYSSEVLTGSHSTHPRMQEGFILGDAISVLAWLVCLYCGFFWVLVVLVLVFFVYGVI